MLNAARVCAVCLLASLAIRPIASAQEDAGCADDAGICEEDGGVDAGPPLACDGALCDTTNGATCSTAGKPVDLAWLAVIAAALAFPILRRRRSGGHD